MKSVQDDPGEKDVCLLCVGDDAIRKSLRPISRSIHCAYCGKRRHGITVAELMAKVIEPLRAYLQQGETNPHFTLESDSPTFEQDGESLSATLQEELTIDADLADDLTILLIESDPVDWSDGGEAFFSGEANYQRARVCSPDYYDAYETFAQRITRERRFFDARAQATLADIFGADDMTSASSLPCLLIGTRKSQTLLYRARRADSQAHATQIANRAATELGPPPGASVRAGRMNAAGISVFYGALSDTTAIAETRPSVGGLVVVGAFVPLRQLRLLDMTKLGRIFTGSIFDPEYPTRAARSAFLGGFHSLIIRPIQPHEEILEYIPTQAVAEYIGNVLGFDGVVYGSAQAGTYADQRYTAPDSAEVAHSECNVVLFRNASRVGARRRKKSAAGEAATLQLVKRSVRVVDVDKIEYTTSTTLIGVDDHDLPF
jgi:hypothetical protein